MLSWMCQYPSLVVQTGRTSTAISYVEFLAWGLRFIVIVIVRAITHLLAFRALVTTVITPGLVPLVDISIAVSPMATGAGVLIIAAASVATLGPATGDLIIAATAALDCLERLRVLL